MANSYQGLNSFLNTNALQGVSGLASQVVPNSFSGTNDYQRKAPTAPLAQVAPVQSVYQPRSIADLQAAIAPERNQDLWQGLLGTSEADYVMPENREMFVQKRLANQIGQVNPDAYKGYEGAFIGTPEANYRAINQQALVKQPMDDVFNAQVFGAYSPFAHQEDPYVKYLNSKYKPTAEGWDLGDGMYYAPKKSFQGNDWDGFRGPTGNAEMDAPTFSQAIEKNWADAFTPEGKFNKEGWKVTKPTSHAMQGILGTLSVIAPALFYGLGMVGTAAGEGGAAAGEGAAVAGSSAAIPAGSEGLMTGSLATEAAPTAAGGSTGMFGNSSLDTGSRFFNGVGEGAIRGGITSGGNPKGIVTGAVSGGLGSASGALSQMAAQYGISPNVLKALLSGTGSMISGALTGNKNPLTAGLTSGLSSYLGNTAGQLTGIRPVGSLLSNLINTRGDLKRSATNTALGALGQYSQYRT